MPRLELKSSRTFLAIKHFEGTKNGKVIKRSRSSIYKLAHICATSGKAVNDDEYYHVIIKVPNYQKSNRFLGKSVWPNSVLVSQIADEQCCPLLCSLSRRFTKLMSNEFVRNSLTHSMLVKSFSSAHQANVSLCQAHTCSRESFDQCLVRTIPSCFLSPQ